MTNAATQQNTNRTPVGQIKETRVVAPNMAELQAKYDLYNNVVLGLLIVAAAIAIAVTAVLVLSSRKSAEWVFTSRHQPLAIVVGK